MDTKVIETISKKAVEQFESIRQDGACNMMDRRCVQNEADDYAYYSLASLTKPEYAMLLLNYSALMEYYQIER